MTEMKTVVLPDGREFDVPECADWMAMDRKGEWVAHAEEPRPAFSIWYSLDYDCVINEIRGPFEPGPWHEQLYWIGD